MLNVSEMEAKVREATNEDPWYVFNTFASYSHIYCPSVFYCARGASSTLMQDIAQG